MMTMRRKWMVLMSGMAAAALLLVPASTPGLGSIECAAPQYYDTLTLTEPHAEHESGMNALRQQAGMALTQLQTKMLTTQLLQ